MKNLDGKGILCRFLTLKNVRAMKIALILLSIMLFRVSATEAFSQERSINLNMSNSTIKEVLKEIENRSDFTFYYNDEAINANKTVSVNVENSRILDVLTTILPNCDFKVVNKNIIITAKSTGTPSATQQKRTITGSICDVNGDPIVGANIVVKGTTDGTVTDIDGNFSISVSSGATLVVSYIGFTSQEIHVGNKNTLSITLKEDSEIIDEVVVLGYGSQLKKTVTGAISSVKAEDLEAPNAVSADNLLQGKIAGLSITQNSAQPGTGMSVNIRGALSPNGSNSPLYVIDGVIISSESNKAAKVGPSNLLDFSFRDGSDRSPLATLNPNDIASIDVLKDASAAAIYGSSAANGVILITTKKGRSGKPQVSYSGSVSVQKMGEYYEMLDAWEYMRVSNLSAKEKWLYDNRYAPYGPTPAPSSGWPVYYTDEQINAQTESYNHFDEIIRTGLINNHNVTMTMGTENFKVYSSFNYFNHESLLKNSDLQRMSGRINMEANFSKYVKLNVASMYTYMGANNPSTGHWRGNANEANQTNAALYFPPHLSLTDENGELTLPENALSSNPLKFSYIKDKTTTKRIMFAPNLEIKFLPYLKANVQLSIDKTDENRDIFSPSKSQLPQQTQKNFGGYSNAYNNNYGIEEYLTFDKSFGKDHHLNAVLGTGYYLTSGNNYSVTVFNFPSDALENNYLELSSDVDQTTYGSSRFERNKLSFFGRFNYTFKDRYIIGATLRNDGSSVFAEDHKWGWFPGVSGAWIISEEKFMDDVNALSYLKLRAGYGTSGNESILTGGNYSLTTYGMATGALYYFNNILNKGIIQKQKGNKELKWETDVTINAGLDFAFFNDRLSGSMDYYVRTANDLLDFASLPATDLVARMAKNIGSTRSTGFEVSLKGTLMQKRDFDWNAYVNISHNHSYWVERNPEVDIAEWIDYNDDLSPIYGWKTDGIFKSQEEIQEWTSNGKVLQPDAMVGNKRYVDINGDGVLDDNDIVKLGNNEPKAYFGLGTSLRYKNWRLDIDTYGVLGKKTYDQWGMRGFPDRLNTSTHFYDVWSTFNPDGWWPGMATDVTGGNNKSGTDDFSLQNTHYWRFKDIKLTYTLPKKLLEDSKIASNASVYFDLQNSLLLTNYAGLDPEMEQNSAPFPIPYTFVFGIDITF